MLRFAAHDDDGPATDWPLVNAYLLGPGEVPVPGEISFQDGHIVCKSRASHTVALCLQHDAGRMGKLMLQTCLLPERKRPYRLSTELARHRIKLFITKSEDWQLFNIDVEHPALKRWKRARSLFSQALNTKDPLEADRVARRSLITGIESPTIERPLSGCSLWRSVRPSGLTLALLRPAGFDPAGLIGRSLLR